MRNRPVLSAALFTLLVFGAMTVYVIATTGFGVLEASALLVVGLFTSGVIGAIREPPE